MQTFFTALIAILVVVVIVLLIVKSKKRGEKAIMTKPENPTPPSQPGGQI